MKFDTALYGNLILGTLATNPWIAGIFFTLAILNLIFGIVWAINDK